MSKNVTFFLSFTKIREQEGRTDPVLGVVSVGGGRIWGKGKGG
jgi:hypothetical protein